MSKKISTPRNFGCQTPSAILLSLGFCLPLFGAVIINGTLSNDACVIGDHIFKPEVITL